MEFISPGLPKILLSLKSDKSEENHFVNEMYLNPLSQSDSVQLLLPRKGLRMPKAEKRRQKRKRGSGVENRIDEQGGPLFIASVEKAFRILSCFQLPQRGLTLNHVAELTKLHPSAVQRSLYTLHMLGYLEKDEKSRTYSPSARLLHLGTSYLRGHTIVERATPYLLLAQAKLKSPFSMVELFDTQVIYVARVPGLNPTNLQIELGTQAPAYCTASGKAILAFMPETEAMKIIARSEIRRYTPFTITDSGKMRREFRKTRSVGFAVSNQEYLIGDISIAAPVFQRDGKVIGAVITGLKANEHERSRIQSEVGPTVVETAQLISGFEHTSRSSRT